MRRPSGARSAAGLGLGLGLWLRWMLANATGPLLAWVGMVLLMAVLSGDTVTEQAAGTSYASVIGAAIQDLAGAHDWPPPAMQALGGLAIAVALGVPLGALQWLVLRGQPPLRRHGAWAWATLLGYVVGSPAAGAAGGMTGLGVVADATVGVAVGAAQWLVLRRAVSRAGWWVPAVALGQITGAAAMDALGAPDLIFLVGSGIAGAVITGSVLVWLLRREQARQQSVRT